jgi:hypothetical protein
MNDGTILLRQIHPAFVQADQATSQAFRPTPKDDGKLSVYDGDKITAEKAWSHYTSTLGCESAGVMGLLVEECTKANVSPASDPAPFPEHCVVDFTKLTTNKEIDNTAKMLKRAANARGWLHP